VDKAACACRDVRPNAELGHIDGTALIDLQEGEKRHIEARPLEIGELVRRLENGLRVGSATKLEVEERHPSHGALFDDPGHRAMSAFLDENARDIGGNAEADIDRIA